MVTRRLSQLAFALLSLLVTAAAQNVNWDVVLSTQTVGPLGQTYLPIASEVVNGQNIDLSKGEGVIGPNIYYNSGSYGFIEAQVPPQQPWDPYPYWYSWAPTLANTQRGTPTATNNVMVFTQTDTFDYEYDLTFYTVWPEVWHGVLSRTLELHEKCGRWPCRGYIPYADCIPSKGCSVSFSDLSDVLELTGTFPIPTH